MRFRRVTRRHSRCCTPDRVVVCRWLGWAVSLLLMLETGCDQFRTPSPPPPSADERAERYAEQQRAAAANRALNRESLVRSRESARGNTPNGPHLLRSVEEWTMAETAADALGRIGSAAVPDLVRALAHPRSEIRKQAARVLARIGPDAATAVPDLQRRLTDTDPEVRQAAARALGQIGPGAARAIPDLIEMLDSHEPQPPAALPAGRPTAPESAPPLAAPKPDAADGAER